MDIYFFEQILSQNLSWNRARIKFLARFLVALFQVQTVNLAKSLVFLREVRRLLLIINGCNGFCVFFDSTVRDRSLGVEIVEDRA